MSELQMSTRSITVYHIQLSTSVKESYSLFTTNEQKKISHKGQK